MVISRLSGLLLAVSGYNILSIDSALYKATMSAKFVDYMERKAFSIATMNKCYASDQKAISSRQSKKVSMTELFDMVAGSETGAILATTLVLPNKD